MLEKPEIDAMLVKKLEEAATKPEGAFLGMMAGMFPNGLASLVPMIKPMLSSFADEMGSQLAETFDPMEFVSVAQIRKEIDLLMTEKLKLLTPPIVKRLLEEVIREHLGWLIVWGNVFGGLIGVVSQIAGYGASVGVA